MKSEAPAIAAHSAELAAFACSLSADSVPPQVLEQARACFTDSIACGLFGATQPWGEMMAENTLAESGAGACTVLGRRDTLSPAPAALVNGTAIHGFELDDLIVGAVVHPGAIVIPAALAAAEHSNASGLRLLLGVIAGYEAMARVALALGVEPAQRGFHMTPVAGPVAAVFAAGVTLGLTRDQLLAAIGLACSAASGIKSFAGGSGGGMVKRMHAGRSAEAGVRMCQLAQRGFTGPHAALDGKFGLLEVVGGSTADASRLTAGLGERWATADVWVKLYPMCGGFHSAVQLLEQLRGAAPLAAEEIRTVRVGTTRYAARNNSDPAPTDTMSAQYSIPYCAAVALLADPKDPAMFASAAIADPAIRALAARVEIFVDDAAEAAYPAKLGARVELQLRAGPLRSAAVMDVHGTPANPCSGAERDARFRQLAGAMLPAVAVERVLQVAGELHRLPTVGPLSMALRSV
jgi:2-methylcitrate dehydratase PrpD